MHAVWMSAMAGLLLAEAVAPGAEEGTMAGRRDWPAYHITALPGEGVNGVICPYDPNGCIWWKGTYHLMYIYQDTRLPNYGHCWGHLTSTNLLDWTHQPTALAPAPADADTGTFSGNAFVNKEGVPMLCWFGIDAGVCVAAACDDQLIRWQKHPANPIIPLPREGDPGWGVYGVWDPYLWLEGDTYYCLLGGNSLPNKKDTLYLMKSPDLVHWTPLHAFYEHADLTWTGDGEDCSCPDFFRLAGDTWGLLCISHKVGARLYTGRYAQERFYPDRHVRMNWPGGQCFAPESLLDGQGRRILWAWVTDPRIRPSQEETGSGFQSLPRVLSLAPDGGLRIVPAPELEGLRQTERRLSNVAVPRDAEVTLEALAGDCQELMIEFAPSGAAQVGVKVRCTPDGQEDTAIWLDRTAGALRVDVSRSTRRTDVFYGETVFTGYNANRESANPHPVNVVEAPLALSPDEPLTLRVFLDGPVLEVFANQRQCVTQVVYPAGAGAVGVKGCARGGDAIITSARAWDMAPLRITDAR